ncbi:MAG: sensor histidine kinase, partial [Xanthomonadales bacterium]|nr:sensor histidine kinase [Xanthomonadales bacterium]
MPPERRSGLKALVSPPSLAACAAWGAVWLGTPEQPDGPLAGTLVRIALVAFLLVFLGEHLLSRVRGPALAATIAGVLAVLAFVAIAGTPHGLSPILLILVAALLAAHFDWKPLLAMLGVMNAVFIGVILHFWSLPPRSLLVYVLAYASFQLFASMVMRSAAQAEGISERLRAANADLLATRGLLAESARDAERLRVARELHDIAGHKLTALKLNLAVLTRDARFADLPQPRLCAQLAEELLADLRMLVARTRSEEGLDLGAALQAVASPFPRPRAHIDIGADARAATLAQAEAILRAAQEALTNSARHSQAQNLWIVLRRESGR